MEFFKIVEKKDDLVVKCIGKWSMYRSKKLQLEIDELLRKASSNYKKIVIDLSLIDSMDTAGAIIIHDMVESLKGISDVVVLNESKNQKKFIEFIEKSIPKDKKNIIFRKPLNFVETIGKIFIEFFVDFWLFIIFIGESSISFFRYATHPHKIRFKAIVKAIENAGVRAVPIVAITSFLVGVVVAYQSAVQLQKFGANIFIVDMIGISVTRELAPLITAIVVAGRSGSSYTAQIGAMKITRELDAMKTMGFDLFDFLITPRIIALMIAMPLLIFFADMVGIFGGMIVSNYQIDISFDEFIKRLRNVLELKQLWIGLVKGPAFAILIASIGCFRGLQVKSNTESIGIYTTISVVNAIFLVIACDALFSIIFTKLGV